MTIDDNINAYDDWLIKNLAPDHLEIVMITGECHKTFKGVISVYHNSRLQK